MSWLLLLLLLLLLIADVDVGEVQVDVSQLNYRVENPRNFPFHHSFISMLCRAVPTECLSALHGLNSVDR